MSLEKNLVFLYPITPVLSELKVLLEEEGEYVIYEMDNINEYKQLIGILEHVVTFSSDMKKTSRYLQENKQFINHPQSLNIAVTKTTIPPHTFGKLQKFGLNEVHKDNVNLKSLEHKVSTFFKRFEAKEEQEQIEKQKASMATDVLIMNKEAANTHIDTESKQHIERMASFDDASSGELKRKKVNLHGLTIGENSQGSANLSGRVTGQFNPEMGVLNNKKLKTLNLPELLNGIKKGKGFTPVERSLNRKSGKLDLPGVQRELERKHINQEQKELNRKDGRLDLPGVQRELERKQINLEQKELNRKDGRLDLPGVQRELERKQINQEQKELNRKDGKLDLSERELKKKDGNLDLPGVEKNIDWNKNKSDDEESKKKRNKFEEVEKDQGHGKGNTDHLETHYGSKKTSLELPGVKEKVAAGTIIDDDISREGISALKSDSDKSKKSEGETISLDKKDWGEQTLDYRQLHKQTKEGNSHEKLENEKQRNKLLADKMAQTSAITYYYPETKDIELLIHIESFLINQNTDMLSFLKFIHFSLYKKFDALISFFAYSNTQYEILYTTHNEEEYSLEFLEEQVSKIDIPTWKDETYQIETNQFIYPYYDQGALLGVAIGHFPDSVFSHEDASRVEMLLMCAKSVFMQYQKDIK